jgi:Beta-lactamase superfamily domain
VTLTLGGALRLDARLVDGRMVVRAFLDDREVALDPALLDALATLVTGRRPEARMAPALVEQGVLVEVAPLTPLPEGRLALAPTTGVEPRYRGLRVDASVPISGFVPAAILERLEGLAERMRQVWRRLASAAHARGRRVDPDEAVPYFEAALRVALAEDWALAEQLTLEGGRLVPAGPLQTPGLQFPITELRFHHERAVSDRSLRWVVDPEVGLAELGRFLGRLVAGVEPEARWRPLVQALWSKGLVVSAETRPALAVPSGSVMHLGHATLLGNLDGRHVLVDPWFSPASTRDTVRPPDPGALPPLAGIFLTHHHWDHVDVETLLRLPKDVPIHVPRQDPTRTLWPHTERLLEELGFTRVVAVSPEDVVPLGGTAKVTVLPFYGEDPTRIGWAGACYVLEEARGRALVHADSGVSAEGQSLAGSGRLVNLAPMLVFATRRQEVGVMVEHPWEFLLRPLAEWARGTENCCNGARELDALVRAAGAERLVLYSEGGAPWYPRGTDFLRVDEDFGVHEYLWESLSALQAGVSAEMSLSRPYDVYRLGDGGSIHG